MEIRCCSYNVRGLLNKTKRTQMFSWLKTQPYDIYLLQETHLMAKQYEIWEDEWGGKAFFSGSKSNSEGICILFKPQLDVKVNNYMDILSGRLQSVDVIVNDKDLTVINVYGPNKDDTSFFDILEDYILNNDEKSFIVGGDFNTVLNADKDKKNGNLYTHKHCRDKINSIVNTSNLVDIWRILNPEKLKFTWHSNTKPIIFCRLDYFLISENLVNAIKSAKIKAGYKSDHSIIDICFDFIKIEKGPGYFKLNNSLLLDTNYQTSIKNNISETVEINKNANPNTLWELIKGCIRNTTIKFATSKKKKEIAKEQELTKEIDIIQNKLITSAENENTELEIKLTNKTKELNDIIDNRINGMVVRSKAQIVEHSEKNSKYFASLEKKRSETKSISKLNIDNTYITNQSEILKSEKKYYENLYRKRDTNNSKYNFFNPNMKKLDENNSNTCDGILNEYECGLALKQMQNNKSPGSDGITIEFYKIFWNSIKTHLVNSLNFSFENQSLTELQKQSIITLLPKPGKDISFLDNWRPISLLNVDYKIATKSIANRLKNVLPSIIHSSQTGFLKNRYIGENIRLLFEVLEDVEKFNKQALLFFSDFQKAFDSVDHNFIFTCLNHFNFGQSFINWIRLFYSDPKSCIINNGFLSESFPIERGVRQGCPISPYLFIICIELLSHEILSNKGIKGITVDGYEIKNTLFADDATFLTDGSKESFTTLIDILDNFSNISGLKLNSSKCTVLKSGSLKDSNIKKCPKKKIHMEFRLCKGARNLFL